MERLRLALADFGIQVTAEDCAKFLADSKFFRLSREPRKIEILNFLDGCDYEIASGRADSDVLGGRTVAILALEDYVASKRTSARPKDLSDLVLLRSMIGPLPGDEVE